MTRVLFLDFDGVLNHREHFKRISTRRTMANMVNDDESFDKAAVAHVNVIVERTGAEVVVSSSWRHGYTQFMLQRILRNHGFAHSLIGVTPDEPRGCRGDEIQMWLDANPGVTSFVILDDDADMGHLAHRLVRTSFATGLLDEHVEAAVRLLETPATP